MVIALETCPFDAQIQSENGSRSVIYKGIPLNVVVVFFSFLMESKKLVDFSCMLLSSLSALIFFVYWHLDVAIKNYYNIF